LPYPELESRIEGDYAENVCCDPDAGVKKMQMIQFARLEIMRPKLLKALSLFRILAFLSRQRESIGLVFALSVLQGCCSLSQERAYGSSVSFFAQAQAADRNPRGCCRTPTPQDCRQLEA
jgi:hypothetical protein